MKSAIAGLMAEARERGFSDALVNEALAGVESREPAAAL